MIGEFSARVKSSNNKARVAFFLLLSLSTAVFVAYFISPLYKGIIGLFGIALITAAVLIFTKYVSAEYYYDITRDADGTPVFVVRQLTGKRQSTLCRIGLSDIVGAKMENAAERRAHKTPVGYRKYVYLPTLMPSITCRLTVSNRYERAEIIIEVGEDFKNLLLSYSAEARANFADDE